MDKSKLLKFKINIELFNCDVFLLFGSAEKIGAFFKNTFQADEDFSCYDAKAVRITHKTGETEYYMALIKDELSWTQYLGLLVHESSHIVDMICEDRGLKCGELRAYMLQHIFQRFLNILLSKKIFEQGDNK